MATLTNPITYPAILRDNRIEWPTDRRITAHPNEAIDIEITIREPAPITTDTVRGERMAQILQAIADSGGVPSIPDPPAWEREVRQDRILSGREE